MKTKPRDDLIVKKSNRLVEARYNWEVNEQKILLLIASNMRDLEGEHKNIWRCRVSELEKTLKVKKFTPVYLKNLSKSMLERKVEMSDDSGRWKIYNVFQGAEYEDGVLSLVLTDFIKPHLREIDILYTQYKFQYVISFKSQYSIRLYELLISGKYKSNTLLISVEEAKKKFGVDDGSYDRFDNFENRVLKVAIKEISQKSNMTITYEKIKKGRPVVDLLFRFNIKGDTDIDPIDKDLADLRTYIVDLSDKTLKSLLKKYSKEKILEKYYIMGTQFCPVSNKAGYMRMALESDYERENELEWKEILFILSESAARQRKRNEEKKTGRKME